jgi:hypothetical protein
MYESRDILADSLKQWNGERFSSETLRFLHVINLAPFIYTYVTFVYAI